MALAWLLAATAWADTTVAFYSHGWGVRDVAYVYFPHAFVLVTRTDAAGDPPTQESFGYTAISQGPDVFVGPTPGRVEPADPAYRTQSVLHFQLSISDADYAALKARVAAWGDPGAPLYDLNRHNCIGFVADLASAVGLKTPPPRGRDPARFLEAVRALNSERLAATAAAP